MSKAWDDSNSRHNAVSQIGTNKLTRLNWIKFLHYMECGCDTTLKIKKIRTILSERELKILTLKWGLKDGQANTLETVGKEFGITRERVRQIEAKALHKLQDKLTGKEKEYEPSN